MTLCGAHVCFSPKADIFVAIRKNGEPNGPPLKVRESRSYHLGSVAIKTKPVSKRLLYSCHTRCAKRTRRSDVSSKVRPKSDSSSPSMTLDVHFLSMGKADRTLQPERVCI